jgi:hypothetical protein
MKCILIVLSAALFACNQKGNKKINVAPGDSLVIQPARPDTLQNDTLSVPGRSVYAQYIPGSVTSWLAKDLPDWNIPDPSKWDKYWWDQYKKNKALVNYLPGDFNCDSQPDHALILTDRKGNVAAWVLIAKNNGFEKVKLNGYENISSGPIGIGLEILPKGEHGDLNHEKAKKVSVKCEGVTVTYFEKAARSYYWENGKMKWIQTGD